MKSAILLVLAVAARSVSAHAAILASNGANGVDSQGFGIDTSTPRDSPLPGQPEQDTSIIRDDEIESGQAGACGRTEESGSLDVATEMKKATANGLATAGADGSVTMTVHQVNQDGAGPFTCDVDATGTGKSFQSMDVTQNVPGQNLPFIGSLSGTTTTNFKLVAQMPAGTKCTGTGGACLVRCRNAAIAGPFGSCVAVGNAGSGTSNSTAAGKRDEMVAITQRDIDFALSRVESRHLRSRVASHIVRSIMAVV